MNISSNYLHIQNTSQTNLTGRLENFYIKKVKALYLFLAAKKMNFLACAITTFLIEPHITLRAGYLMQRRFDKKKFTPLNPKQLSSAQLKRAPVLFIHGDSSNSGLFSPMIDQVLKDSPDKPIFTIDLKSPDGIVSAKSHLHLIVDKVKEILALYPASINPKISFVGHSSGGDVLGPLVRTMNANNLPSPGTIIKIGSVFKKIEANEFQQFTHENVMEILGTKDIYEGCESQLPNKLIINSGHVGLLFNKTVIKRVSEEMKLPVR